MKILHINFSDQGGAAVASMDLHEELLKQEINSKYLTLNLTTKHLQNLHYYSHRKTYTTILDRLWFLRIRAYWINKKNKELLQKVATPNEIISLPFSCFDITKDPLYQDADIIHLHWTSRFLDWPSFFKKNKKPIIWTLHDKNPFSGILHCNFEFPKPAVSLELKYLSRKAKYIANNNIEVVSPSSEYKNLSQKSFVLQKFPHTTILHGIPNQVFYPLDKIECRKKHGIELNKYTIVSVATSLTRKLKGFHEIIEYAKKESDINFIFIGETPKENLTYNNIHFLGQITDRKKLNIIYNCADAVISNSSEESFGLTLAEALFTGTPVICKKIGGFLDFVVNKKNGIFINNSVEDAISECRTTNWNQNNIINSVNGLLNLPEKTKKYIELYKKSYKK